MRTYPGDLIRVKMQAGAHEEEHNASIHGMKWLQGGSGHGTAPNSGWRNSQAAGISEQFTLTTPVLPVEDQLPQAQIDYLYSMDYGNDGFWSGMWGIIRSHQNLAPNLVSLPKTQVPVVFTAGDAGRLRRRVPGQRAGPRLRHQGGGGEQGAAGEPQRGDPGSVPERPRRRAPAGERRHAGLQPSHHDGGRPDGRRSGRRRPDRPADAPGSAARPDGAHLRAHFRPDAVQRTSGEWRRSISARSRRPRPRSRTPQRPALAAIDGDHERTASRHGAHAGRRQRLPGRWGVIPPGGDQRRRSSRSCCAPTRAIASPSRCATG